MSIPHRALMRAFLIAVLMPLPTVSAPLAGQETLRHGSLHFHYWPGHRNLARRLAQLTAAAPALPALPPEALADPINIWLPPDEARFDSLAGGGAPEWGAGIAIPARSIVILPAYATDRVTPAQLPRVLRHELAHIGLHRAMHPLRIPRWFDEGFSRWAAGELDPEATWRLRLAFALGGAPPLDSLTLDWPRASVDAEMAYLLSASAIQYLVSEGGVRGLRLLLERWRELESLDAAMRATYGVTLGQFEEDWRGHVKRRYGWAAALGHATIFWALAAILLIVLYIRRRRRDREKMDALRATEPPDQPEYWNEPF